MRKFPALIFFLNFFSGFSQAQIIGSDTVCAGYIYSYSINIPGAVGYNWTVPMNWYDLSGQGTAQITVTCNSNGGQLCVEGFDSLGGSAGYQCLSTSLGISGGGGGGWELQPTGTNYFCDDAWMTGSVTPTITPNGTGGGGCLNGCGGGSLHPNIIWALYNGQYFVGLIGTSMNLGLGSYYAAHVDTTLGRNFPQAVIINEGCGGTIDNSFSIAPIGLNVMVYQQLPDPVCIGDTVFLYGNGVISCLWNCWDNLNSFLPLTSQLNPSWIQGVVTGPASVNYTACSEIQSGIFWGTTCESTIQYYIHVVDCNASASFQSINTSVCENDCINFINNSTNAISYEWNFPGANPSTSTDLNPTNICYGTIGSYDITLIAISSSGDNDTITLSNYITVTLPPQSAFSASQTNICPGSCIDFINSSIGASTYNWNFPGANADTSSLENPNAICYNNSGQYDVELVCSNGACSDTAFSSQYILVYPSPPPVTIQQSDDTLFASQGFASYQWYQDGNLISGATDSFYFCTSNGDYNVVASDTNGCEVEAAIYNVLTRTTSELFYRQDFVVYPNPTKDLFKIVLPATFELTQNTSLRILDIQNRVVFSNRLSGHTIDVNQLGVGIYVIEIVGDNSVLRSKLLKN